jgi:hypothetical protein
MVLHSIPNQTMRRGIVAGFVFLFIVLILGMVQTGPIDFERALTQPFAGFLLLTTVIAHFGLGFASFVLWKEHDLVMPIAITIFFVIWSIVVTLTNWEAVTASQAYNPFALYPIPIIAKWVVIWGIFLVAGFGEYFLRNIILE